MHWITFAKVSQEFDAAGELPGGYFHALADMLVAGHDCKNAALLFTALGLGVFIYNYLLYRTKLAPRW